MAEKTTKIVVYDGGEQIEKVELPGSAQEYDIIISTDEREFADTQEVIPPVIPEIPEENIDTDSRQKAYRRMRNNDASAAAEVRKIIHSNEIMTRKELDQWAEENGYSASSGTLQEALVALEKTTEEIERIGEGPDKRIKWVGKR